MARRLSFPSNPKPTRGWHRVTLPNIPNPWAEVLQGTEVSCRVSTRIITWLNTNLGGKCKYIRYNTWDFKRQEDALLFTLTWG